MNIEEADIPEKELAAAKKLSKADMKRYQIYQERRNRLLNKGVPEDKVDQTLAEEDYKNSPLEARFTRFEKVVVGAIRGFQTDIANLHHNDRIVADAMDVNLRAMAKALIRVGVTKEMQMEIIKEVEKEVEEHHRMRAEASKKEREAAEQKNVETSADVAPADEPVPVPEGATVFGG